MENKYTIDQLEKMRKISLILYVTTIVIAIITFIFIITQSCSLSEVGGVFLLSVTLFAIATKLKIFVIPGMIDYMIKKCSLHFKSLNFSQEDGIPEKEFKDAGFIKKYTEYYSSNCIFGKFSEKNFIISDIVVKNRISTSQKNENSVLFEGVFGITDFVNEDNIEMIIGPDIRNKFLNNISEEIKRTIGANRKIVRLENSEFERYYEVYCDDQVAARKIITLLFMERMVEFTKMMKKHITLIYMNNKIYFTVENKHIIDTTKLYLEGVTHEMVKETTKFLKIISEIVDRYSIVCLVADD